MWSPDERTLQAGAGRRPRRRPRRRARWAGLLLAVALAAGCAGAGAGDAAVVAPTLDPAAAPTLDPAGPTASEVTMEPGPPGRRTVAVGYEDVVGSDAGPADIAGTLDAVDADTVAVSAGRADWTSFRWDGHEERWADPTADGEQDPFTRTVSALGAERDVVAVVDVFAPRHIEEHPQSAALDADGEPSEFQVSIVELTEGEHGDALVAMVAELAARDDVDAVSLTELHYDDAGLGEDDEAAFVADTGADGWPRDSDGDVDWRDPDVADWRSERVAGFVERAAKAAHENGAALLVDVRSPRDGGTEVHGQDYGLLLEHADRLVIWHYPGLRTGDGSSWSVSEVADEALALARAADPEATLDRFVLSVGLWAQDDAVLGAEELRAELIAADEAGLARTWVTPWSLLDEEHAEAVADAWE